MSTDTDRNTPPVRMTVHAELAGWPVDLAFDMPPSALSKALERLTSLGYTPRPPQRRRPLRRPRRPPARRSSPSTTATATLAARCITGS